MNEFYKAALNPIAKDYDLAIVPIDEFGSLGNLNAKVLMDFGYSQNILQELDLKKGYDIFELSGRPLLFVVTISNRRATEELLRENLYTAIRDNARYISQLRTWLPLLGTGVGSLSYEESWHIVRSVLDDLREILLAVAADITIAIPSDQKGKELFENIQNSNNIAGTSGGLYNLLENGKQRFFLVGSSWGGDDQAERFYQDSIWETGYDDARYRDIINSVHAGDILIHKSTYPTKAGDSLLRIKGWGRVDENPHDGSTLYVNWVERGLKRNIKDLGYYRSTIAEPSVADLATILQALPANVYTLLLTSLKDFNQEQTHVAGLLSDSDSGTDQLGIMPDVNSFALVLAAKTFEPPLAVALLGRWGSGKSFFMRKLKEQIVSLANRDSLYFCHGIAHVHFNAWSYMDTNLWASITTRIFEGLSQYIKSDSLAKDKEKEVEEKLTKDLSVTQDELKALNNERLEIEGQLEKLGEEKDKFKMELDKKISQLQTSTLADSLSAVDEQFNVRERLESAIKENPGIAPNLKELKKMVPEEYWATPEEIYDKARSLPVLFRLFIRSKDGRFNTVWFVLTCLLLIVIPILMLFIENWLKLHTIVLDPTFWFFITFITSLYVQGRKAYNRIQPFLSRMWEIRGKYLEARNTAVSRFEQQEKALIQQIEYGKSELDSINGQISSVTILKSSIEFKIKNAKSTQALYDFIDKRCNSEDYKKHLGLVSLIRKDFETLSGLLMGHHRELSDRRDSEEFKKLFDKPLERIILYIDDLDRCPEERVVEVLEAVNLLMAFPLFVVVVGVDPAWVRSALTTKHKKQFTFKDIDSKPIEPSDYLEKIFQISFHLKAAEESSVKSMLRSLAKVQVLPIAHEQSVKLEDGDIEPDDNDQDMVLGEVKETARAVDEVPSVNISYDNVVRALTFTDQELAFIEDMSIILGDSPRLLKRFINIYRIIKSHENISKTVKKDSELKIILLLLAITLSKYRPLIPSMRSYFDQSKGNRKFAIYLNEKNSSDADSGVNSLKDNLSNLLSQKRPEMLSLEADSLRKHFYFIQRFSF